MRAPTVKSILRYAGRRVAVAACAFAFALVAASRAHGAEVSAELRPLSMFGSAPIYFEANNGQAEGPARFIARGQQCNILLSPAEAALVLGKVTGEAAPDPGFDRVRGPVTVDTHVVRMILAGADANTAMTGDEAMNARANYFIGSGPEDWHTKVPLFGRVRASQVYPGIDLTYYCSREQLEYDFILQPGANPNQISFRIEGASSVRLDTEGNLLLGVGDTTVRQHKPVAYQEIRGVRRAVDCNYRLTGTASVAFDIGRYDATEPLVIDPTLAFSTYLGGTKQDVAWDVALDSETNIYLVGETLSTTLNPTNRPQFITNALQPNSPITLTNMFNGHSSGSSYGDAFVAKYDATPAHNLVFLDYIGGRSDDGAFGVAVGSDGVFVTGYTDSTNFPVTADAVRVVNNGDRHNAQHAPPLDAFVTELSFDGSSILYSTLLGGTAADQGNSIAVDGAGYVYVAGLTLSTNFFPGPTNTFQTTNLASSGISGQFAVDGFAVRFMPGGPVAYMTYLGGSNNNFAMSISPGTNGNAYITGYTASTNFPTLNATNADGTTRTNLNGMNTANTNRNFDFDAFVTKLDPSGAGVYSYFLGGHDNDQAFRIRVDKNESAAYVTGSTASTNFPVTYTNPPSISSTNRFLGHIFLTEFDCATGTNIFSTQFGSSNADRGLGLAIGGDGRIYISGSTTSLIFPTNNAGDPQLQHTNRPSGNNTNDVIVSVLQPSATLTNGPLLFYSVELGGNGNEQGNGIAVDGAGNAYIVGSTSSINFPTNFPAGNTTGFGKYSGGGFDAFVAVIKADPDPGPVSMRLDLQMTGGAVIASWPASAGLATLEWRQTFADAWAPVGIQPILSNGVFTVTLDATSNPAFFRLHRQ